MESLEQIKLALLVIIPVCATARIIYCAIKMETDDEESGKMKKRIKNIIAVLIISICLASIVTLVSTYYPLDFF